MIWGEDQAFSLDNMIVSSEVRRREALMSNEDDLPLTLGGSVDKEKVTEKDEGKLKLAAARAHAVGEAMREVMGEHQVEIIKRARAKLVAMGVKLDDDSELESMK